MPEPTIADRLERLIGAKGDIDTAVTEKGGTVTKGLENSDDDIMTIPTPTPPVLITKTITGNGVYKAEDEEADGYSAVTVDVGDEDYTINIGLIRSRMYNTGFAIVGSIVEEV